MEKFTKKFLATLSVAVLVGAGLASCGGGEAEVSQVLKDAVYALDQTYASEAGKKVTADFERPAVYYDVDDNAFPIDWSIVINTKDAPTGSVDIVVGKDKKDEDDEDKVKIDVNEESEMDVAFTLKGVMHYGSESKALAPLDMTVAKLNIVGWDEYVAKCKVSGSSAGDEKNSFIGVEGYVTALIGTANGNSSQAVYAQSADNKGAFYGYGLSVDPSTVCKIGDKVRIVGESGLYSGSYELLKPSLKLLDDSAHTTTAVDYTSKYEAATTLKDESLTAAQGLYVEIKDVEITGENASNGYYKFKKGDLESYVRISSSVCPISKDAQNKMKADHAAKLGYMADVKGIINLFDGAFYLTPIDAEPFTFKSLPIRTPVEQVEFEKTNLTVTNLIEKDTVIDLPTTGHGYTDVAISWALGGTYNTTTLVGNTLTIVQGEEDETIALTATLTNGAASDTKDFEIVVNAKATDPFVVRPLTEAKAGTYKFALAQNKIGQYLFADGTVNDSEYLATTTNASKAATFTVAGNETDGYTIKVDDKFVEIYENGSQKVRIRLAAESSTKWAWNEEANVFTMTLAGCGNSENDGEYYLGTYGTYNTISASKVSFITGENASKVGVSQFPAYFGPLAAAVYRLNALTEAKAGTYKFALAQNKIGEFLFADGTVNDSEYLATTTNLDKSADFVVAGNETEGYTIKVADKFVEIYENGSQKVRIRLAAESSTKWAWNDEANLFTMTLAGCGNSENDGEYYLGTYGTYNTISASKVSFITGENASKVGVSQFPAYLGSVVFKEATINSFDNTPGSYKMMLEQNKIGQLLLADGTVNDSEYLATTTNASKAATFTVAGNETDGYTIKVDDKFVEIYENGSQKVRIRLAAESSTKWAWNEEANVFTMTLAGCGNSENDGEYYLGTYGTYNTISASKVSFITGENASKVGVSQFPVRYGFLTAK